jgi:cystathionine beta-lyase/cystathionine gamma-synthase
MKEATDFKTLCVHSGELKDIQHGGAISPLYMSTSYAFNDVEINQYPRYFNTPNQRGLAKKDSCTRGSGSRDDLWIGDGCNKYSNFVTP